MMAEEIKTPEEIVKYIIDECVSVHKYLVEQGYFAEIKKRTVMISMHSDNRVAKTYSGFLSIGEMFSNIIDYKLENEYKEILKRVQANSDETNNVTLSNIKRFKNNMEVLVKLIKLQQDELKSNSDE